ncbi:unnamed protein product [Clonostachys rosea]|uniref:Major facilitator superfamily (MFS) profile domain-containing protein n=1 Tax=Bionectria ochroleuca TaxID=29856 RepID=A0ABY6TVA3_BIOOC|nr:unnamed protein product [Clonostachys rosea]
MSASIDEMLPGSGVFVNPQQRLRSNGGNGAFHNFYNDYSHIQDPNLRRRLALSEIDKVPFGKYHVRAVLVAGVGFFLDSYDIFAINLITTLLGLVFWGGGDPADGYGGNNGLLPDPVNQALKASTSSGIIIGQILFGWMADAYGRRKMYGFELGLIIWGTFSCAMVSSSPAISSTAVMIFWRVVMGIGIGGDYPLSSVITAEFAPTRWRGAMVAAVFSMQGMGQLICAMVALMTAIGFRSSYVNIPNESLCDSACRLAADRSWRIIVGVGAIPACLALYYRITIPETPRYTFDVQFDVEKADADIRAYMSRKSIDSVSVNGANPLAAHHLPSQKLNMPKASWGDLYEYFKAWRHLKVLLGTSLSWFFLDLAFYGLGLNNTIVLHAIGHAEGSNLHQKLFNQAVGMIILACAGSIPGYWFAVFTIDTFGRKSLQIIGFLLLTIVFAILGFKLRDMGENALLALYIVGQFLFNAGPNTTTFIVAGECFPTRYRSTAHGLSAAMGKLGAIIAQVISIPMLNKDSPPNCKGNACSPHLDKLLQMFALFMLLGTLVSFLIPETKGYTLEELAGEPRTSYNAGRNGSISFGTNSHRPFWNPFGGGQPAGFFYPRSKETVFTTNDAPGGSNNNDHHHRSSHNTITKLPRTLESIRHRRSHLWWRRRRAQNDASRNEDITLSSRSSSHVSHQHHNVGIVPEETSPMSSPAAPPALSPISPISPVQQQAVPTWGAGWGRIDRGRRPPQIDEVQLQDVGSLLNRGV